MQQPSDSQRLAVAISRIDDLMEDCEPTPDDSLRRMDLAIVLLEDADEVGAMKWAEEFADYLAAA